MRRGASSSKQKANVKFEDDKDIYTNREYQRQVTLALANKDKARKQKKRDKDRGESG